jgi:hypothetical protein
MSNQMVRIGIGITGLVLGAIVGGVATKVLNPSQAIIAEGEVIKEEISMDELEAMCAELTDIEKKSVLEVQGKVSSLQAQLSEKEAELAKIKGKSQKNAKSRAAAKKKWQQMEEDIAMLHIRLASAEQERDDLKVELQETLVVLSKQIKKTKKFKAKAKKYKIESTAHLWKAFRSQAKVEGCNRGSKRRHVKCYEAFDLAMSSEVKGRFNNCVDTYQAVPVLRELEKGDEPPQFSALLNQENKYTKNWYVIFCDPTLPEARDSDLDEEVKPRPSRTPNEELDDFDLDIDFDALPEK